MCPKALVFRERHNPDYLVLIRNFAVEDYARILNNAACIAGNTSSGLSRRRFPRTPCVNIGSRQRNRERADNVVDGPHDVDAIYAAIERQISNVRFARSLLFGDGHAGQAHRRHPCYCAIVAREDAKLCQL